MTAQQIASILPYILVSLFLLALILLLLALQQLRRGRTGPYWRLRRQAGQRGGRLLLLSVGLFALTFALAFYSGLAAIAFRGIDSFFRSGPAFAGVVLPTMTPTPAGSPTATATPTSTLTATPVPTVTIPPSATPSATPTLTPTLTTTPSATPTATDTLTPTLTLTPSPTFEALLRLTPPPSNRQPQPDASVQIIAADESLTPNGTPVQPRADFSAGIRRIYLFLTYENMDNGVPWSRVLYRDSVPIQGQAYLWGMGREGSSFFFFGNEAGYEPGSYAVEIHVGGQVVSSFSFTIHPA